MQKRCFHTNAADLFREVFYFMEKQVAKQSGGWKRALFSPTLMDKSLSHRLAYIAVVTALVVVCNMFFEFKLRSEEHTSELQSLG